MKILLIGEFSGLHLNLKAGLQALGHEVTIAAYMDGFKKIPIDITLGGLYKGFTGKIEKFIKPLYYLNSLKGFDVIQLINANYFWHKFNYDRFIVNRLIDNNGKSFLLAAGCDSFFWKYGRDRLKYAPFNDNLLYDYKSSNVNYERKSWLQWNTDLVDKVDGVIPIMYEYQQAYRHCHNIKPCIALPVDVDTIPYLENTVKDKLVVFHGLNRYGYKGTRFVEEAFKTLNARYPDKLELIIDGNMPLSEYLELMSRSNVVIDQLWSHSNGMNGVYALAMGKVVLGGAEQESLQMLGVKTSPVINLTPDANSIVVAIEVLLAQVDQFPVLGFHSRKFAEQIHGHITVAQQYINAWNCSGVEKNSE
ncbi:hypothetical protein MNBD_GAMMA12-1275 [hydrothermal vent metagenome]|uniref:Glycosyltransferase n=1 Tax=hydrothermal vent metagenome TaxID=652676 RepID=A0A3B0YRM7_9ZZZZ